MGGGVITPPYNGWYETYEFELDDQLIKADNLNTNLSYRLRRCIKFPPGGSWRKRGNSLPVEGHAVGALIHSGIALVGTHQNPVQGAVILAAAVMGALMHGAFNGLVGVTIHNRNLLSLCRVRRGGKFMRIDFSQIM